MFPASPLFETKYLRPTLPKPRPKWRLIVKPRGLVPFWARRRTSTTKSLMSASWPTPAVIDDKYGIYP